MKFGLNLFYPPSKSAMITDLTIADAVDLVVTNAILTGIKVNLDAEPRKAKPRFPKRMQSCPGAETKVQTSFNERYQQQAVCGHCCGRFDLASFGQVEFTFPRHGGFSDDVAPT